MDSRQEYYRGRHLARQQRREAVKRHNGQRHLSILLRAQTLGEMLHDWQLPPRERDITAAFMVGYASAIWGWVIA